MWIKRGYGILERRGLRGGVLGGVASFVVSFGFAFAAELTLKDAFFQKIVNEDGRTIRKTVLIDQAQPGEELSYVLTYSNPGNKPVHEAVIATPVPKELEYISTSIVKTGGVDTASFEVSVDGGAHYGPLPQLMIMSAEGESRKAKARDVTHVRWSLKSVIGAEEDLVILLRGRVRERDTRVPSKEISREPELNNAIVE